MTKVVDWEAAFRELCSMMDREPEVRIRLAQEKHAREVPEGLATQLEKTLRSLRPEPGDCWIERCGCNHCVAVGVFDKAGGYNTLTGATPEACAALDADAKAMRVRRAVEESGCFEDLCKTADGTFSVAFRVERLRAALFGDTVDDAYASAHEALRKAGKL